MNFRNPLLLSFCFIILVLFSIGMYLMLTKTNDTALQNASNIILYCFSGVPLVMIGGAVFIILAFIIYILSNILVSYNKNITQAQIEIARALNENNQNNRPIIINTGDKKALSTNKSNYQLPVATKQNKHIKYNGIDSFDNENLNLNGFLNE